MSTHVTSSFEPLLDVRSTRALEEARAYFRDAFARIRRDTSTCAIVVRAPLAPIEAPVRAFAEEPTFIFAPPEGPAIACWGAARSTRLWGSDRLAEGRRAATALLDGLRTLAAPGALLVPPRLFLGLAFAPGSASAPPWESFGDGALILPRWTYATDGHRASLTFVTPPGPFDEQLALAELDAWLQAIAHPAIARPAPVAVAVEALDRARWNDAVEAIRAVIAGGGARKIVVARRTAIATTSHIDPFEVLTRLTEPHTASTRFLVRFERTSFVGATPEHLFTLRGNRIHTEALAGSIAADAPDAENRLLASPKEREEHTLVVRHLVERLEALGARVKHPQHPEIRRLPTVLHLRTPIEAELPRPHHPFEFIEALHPTPAVGGTPPETAAAWIAANEPAPRGWYGGPLGWLDARGNAEVVVALRCGVLDGPRAWLWAGSGIVAGSDPEREWDETALKMRPMLRVLGVSP